MTTTNPPTAAPNAPRAIFQAVAWSRAESNWISLGHYNQRSAAETNGRRALTWFLNNNDRHRIDRYSFAVVTYHITGGHLDSIINQLNNNAQNNKAGANGNRRPLATEATS
jgi:hypothetical protein